MIYKLHIKGYDIIDLQKVDKFVGSDYSQSILNEYGYVITVSSLSDIGVSGIMYIDMNVNTKLYEMTSTKDDNNIWFAIARDFIRDSKLDNVLT